MNFQVFFSVFISSFGGVLFQFITFVTCVFFWRLSNHIEKSIGKTPKNYAIPMHGEKCHRPKMRTKITQKSICFIFPNITLLKHLDANNAPEKKQEKKP